MTAKGFLKNKFAIAALTGAMLMPMFSFGDETATDLQKAETSTNTLTPEEQKKKDQEAYNLFLQSLEIIRESYIDPSKTNYSDFFESAVRGAVKDLDPHSAYQSPEEFKRMQEDMGGNFAGVGMRVRMVRDTPQIAGVMDNTPAFNSGAQENDYIIAVDGKNMRGLPLEEVVKMMRGKPDTEVKLTLLREGLDKPLDITIKRAIIKVPSIQSKKIGNDIGYIALSTFGRNSAQDLRNAVLDLKEDMGDNVKGYVIDLRNNGGGLLTAATRISDDFLENGNIVTTRRRNRLSEIVKKTYTAHRGDITDGKPIVVLVNGASASASEIVSGALQDNGRAIILGTQSFGKGSVQQIIPLPNGGALRLTTGLYFTASGRSIQNKGITPDILFKPAKGNRSLYKKESEMKNTIKNPNLIQDNTKTKATCSLIEKDPDITLDTKESSIDKTMLNSRGKPDGALVCAVENLRKDSTPPVHTLTKPIVVPTTPAAPKP